MFLVLDFPGRDDFDEDDDDDENYQLFRFDATADMQNEAIAYSRHIKTIGIYNRCTQQEEHSRCFTFYTKIVQGIIGNGKHLVYNSFKFEFELEQAHQLANALRSNNNNNGAIEIPLWNALLDSGVRKIAFWNTDRANNLLDNTTTIDFTGIETNKSLTQLFLKGYRMREGDYRNLFHSMKKNKGLEKLELNYNTYKELPEKVKRLFEEMMCENITLLDCILHISMGRDEQDQIFEVIQGHMKLNCMWKRYIMKREREKNTSAVITKIEERDNNNNNNEEEEKKKKKIEDETVVSCFSSEASIARYTSLPFIK